MESMRFFMYTFFKNILIKQLKKLYKIIVFNTIFVKIKKFFLIMFMIL